MKITIISSDGAVYKDGYSYSGLNLSFIPADIHALQFNDATNKGWIEFKDDEFGNKPGNQLITVLPVWVNDCLAKWDEAETARLAAEEAEAAALAARIAIQNQSTTQS
jgi:hypothetical protein